MSGSSREASRKAQGLVDPSREYLKEKVVTIYESLWNGTQLGENGVKELFNLKVNASWLHTRIASVPSAALTEHKALVRWLFAACCERLDEESVAADVQCHAMETVAGILLGLGSRTFHDPASEVLELLCGIEATDAVFGRLYAYVGRVLSTERRGGASQAVRRSAVRLLLAVTAAASDLHTNIFVDLLMPHHFEVPLAALLQQGGADEAGASASKSGAGAVAAAASHRAIPPALEDVALLVVLLAAYRRHESPNAFLKLLSDAPAESAQLQALAQTARRAMEACMYPSPPEESAASSYLGASWSYSLARYAKWAAHTLTIENYLPAAVTSLLSSPEALRANATLLTVALLTCYELGSQRGGATLAALCAQQDVAPPNGTSGVAPAARRGALVRHVFSVASILACDAVRTYAGALNACDWRMCRRPPCTPRSSEHAAGWRGKPSLPRAHTPAGQSNPVHVCVQRDPLLVAQLRLALLIIERMLEGGASAPLLLSVDLGGHLPLWRFSSMHVQETTLPSPQPLLAGGYTLLADLLTQNLRKATFDTALYLQALALLHRLLVAQHRSSQSLYAHAPPPPRAHAPPTR